jgi:hypothetical protein
MAITINLTGPINGRRMLVSWTGLAQLDFSSSTLLD